MRGEVIVGYDGRDPALDAVVLGRLLAEVGGVPLSLAIALPYDPLLVGLEEYESGLEQDSKRLLERAQPYLEGVEFETRAYGGESPARLLNDLAEREGAEVIVLGSTHRGAIGSLVPGSVAERLLAGAPCSVAVAPRGFAERERPKLGAIGVGFDGSEESRGALRVAAELADASGAALRMFAIVEPPGLASPEAAWMATSVLGGGDWDVESKRERRLEEAVSEALASLPDGIDSSHELVGGDPGTILIERSREVDLLVIGSRRYGPVRRVLLGDVSERVVRNASSPVVVVPRGAGES